MDWDDIAQLADSTCDLLSSITPEFMSEISEVRKTREVPANTATRILEILMSPFPPNSTRDSVVNSLVQLTSNSEDLEFIDFFLSQIFDPSVSAPPSGASEGETEGETAIDRSDRRVGSACRLGCLADQYLP
jgi:hypothetical protein